MFDHKNEGELKRRADESLKKGKSRVIVDKGQVVKISKDKNGIVGREVLTQNWTDWIDYWAVDFDFESKREIVRVESEGGFEEVWTGDYVFENEWQSFRTKKTGPWSSKECSGNALRGGARSR